MNPRTKILRSGAIALVLSIALTLTVWLGTVAVALAAPLQLAQASVSQAQAVVRSTEDPSVVLGEATFTEQSDGLRVDVSLSNVPTGFHGFHIHEVGSCDTGGSAAGGHFNPLNVKHGYLVKDGFEAAHAGDLGNILILADGSGELQETISGLPLTEGETAILNHAVILHSDRDDFGQPTGNAGGRIGCGIIEPA